jgi:hypothetical protein
MNQESDIRFLELATRTLAGTSTSDEVDELRALIANNPARDAEFQQLKNDTPVIREALALCLAAQAPAVNPPPEILLRLRSATTEALASTRPRWWSRIPRSVWLVAAAIGLAMVTYFWLSDKHVELQIVRFDRHGSIVGLGTTKSLLISETMLHSMFPDTKVGTVGTPEELEDWNMNWPRSDRHPVAKLILEPASRLSLSSGQVRVIGRWQGRTFQRTFPVLDDSQWRSVLERARRFVAEETR